MTMPEPRSSMAPTTERVSRNGAVRLTRTTSSNACGSVSTSRGNGLGPTVEALLTSTSTLAKRASVSDTRRSRSAGLATSAGTASTSAPSSRHSEATVWSAGSPRAHRARAAPSRAKSSAMACPSPFEAPVIRATLPCSWFMVTWFRLRRWSASGPGPAKDPVFRPIRPEGHGPRVCQDLTNEPLADGEDRRGCPIRYAELLEDAAHVRLHRLLGYPQPPRDLLVGEAFDHELKHL